MPVWRLAYVSVRRQFAVRTTMPSGRSASSRGRSSSNDQAHEDEDCVETLSTPCHVRELVVKKSRFIACAAPAPTEKDALAFVQAASEDDARHNCWAFYTYDKMQRSSDDGEPSGTAGKPILAAIQRSGLAHAVVVVVRYFGGIKLGAGGLTRAYSTAASECLAEAPRERAVVTVDIRVSVPHAAIGEVMSVANAYTVLDVEYR